MSIGYRTRSTATSRWYCWIDVGQRESPQITWEWLTACPRSPVGARFASPPGQPFGRGRATPGQAAPGQA